MADLRRSPLAHLGEVALPGASLAEVPFLVQVNLRVAPSAAAVAVEKALGAALPLRCGETTSSGPRTALWLGPDEWLVVSSPDDTVFDELREALGGEPGSVVDVSANRTVVELSGPAARDVLEKGCTVDLHPRAFGPGRAVSTVVGPVPVVLWQVDDQTYRLLPRSSFADYLARWLIDAAHTG